MSRIRLYLPALILLTIAACAPTPPSSGPVRVTMLGMNDVHGELAAREDRGGLVTMSAYINAARQATAETGDAVLVIDAGDMWQGTIESNLNEGAAVVEAYNAIGIAAAAIGNHEFDFGPVGDKPIPVNENDDARGALKQRIRESNFPVLAANLIDDSTGRPVEWDNVSPSVVVNAGGVSVGIIGVMSENALVATIAANTVGLSVAPLVDTISREASALRKAGVDLVIVSAHAGGFCSDFSDPQDLCKVFVLRVLFVEL